MTRRALLVLVLLLTLPAVAQAHDLFLKLARYVVPPHSDVRVYVLNGTFSTSENAVTRDRVRDISVIAPGGVTRLDTTAWRATGTRPC